MADDIVDSIFVVILLKTKFIWEKNLVFLDVKFNRQSKIKIICL